MIAFIGGLMVGVPIGIFLVALMEAGRDGD